MAEPERLSETARIAIESGGNVISVITYWEVMLKAIKGKLTGVGDPRSWWEASLSDFAATPLVLRPEHVAATYNLPLIHQDPFDRMLIAQATVERMVLLTTDELVSQYANEHLTIVRS
jgi:PIN domain nuclease of toxin-antitoxin system